jgi:hypothetical protein
VRLETNADAVLWVRCIDARARTVRVPDLYGRLYATCDWLGWTLTVTGAPQPPPDLPTWYGVSRGQAWTRRIGGSDRPRTDVA